MFKSLYRNWKVIGAIALLLLMLGAGLGRAQDPTIVAKVDYAKSGHTLELLSELSADIPVMDVRLAGVQAPDRDQKPWGREARQCLQALTEQSEGRVRVEPQSLTPDGYGRIWAYVWQGKQLVNAAVLAEGCAFLDSDRLSQQRYGEQLIYAQESARLLGLGIWDPDNPLRETPASFRQSRRDEASDPVD
ncbi:MAG: thermonuclease family protein [Cyanobacteria bacterium J06626_18]